MTKKKRFGISEALTRGLTETINVVENNAGLFRNVILPLSRIELDPDNPRKLTVDISDIKMGLRSDDSRLLAKQSELEKLKELAHTIKTNGIINPIVVYKHGEIYRVIAGERRCLASILAGKQEIDARVFQERPKAFELKLLQWVENTAREDLTLDERLGNIKDILTEYQKQQPGSTPSATLLKNITGLSLPQCSYYLTTLNAPEDVAEAIQNGSIRNLDKAAMIASIRSLDLRQQAIKACINGSTIKELRNLISQQKQSSAVVQTTRAQVMNLNQTLNANPKVIRTLVEAVLKQEGFKHHFSTFKNVNWLDNKQATKAFRKLVDIIEGEIVL